MERPPMEKALSTDIVLDIVLSHLKARDLLNCRTVSKFWNKTASAVLRKRSTRIKDILNTKTLTELGQCLKQSSDFPFTGLKFGQPWKLRTIGAMKFMSKYGTRFTSLYLATWSDTRLEDLAPFINQLPRLSILEVGDYYPLPAASLNSALGQEDGTILSLPSLRTVRISAEFNEKLLREVFAVAPSFLRIECLRATYGVVQALKHAGKLQAVSVMNVVERHLTGHQLRVAELQSSESPTLTKLDFHAPGCLSLNGLKELLISSQDTLKYLRLAGIWSPELLAGCPELTKLTALTLHSTEYSHQYVFQGRHGHKFPQLKELKIDITWGTPLRYKPTDKLSDGLCIVPSVIKIDLGTSHVDKNQMEGLARSFPNVIEVQLKFQQLKHFTGFTAPADRHPIDIIWNVGEFNCLEKLRVWNYTVKGPNEYLPTEDYRNMDNFLTGIPAGICENLRKHQQLNLMDSPFNELLRDKPSILQLRNLKELVLCRVLEEGFKELPEEPPFISMVSVWYALQMIPNLEARFMYDYGWLSRKFKAEDRDEAVKKLKVAFKHVQPYVELEPFFY